MEQEIIRLVAIAGIALILGIPIFAGWHFYEQWAFKRRWRKFVNNVLGDYTR